MTRKILLTITLLGCTAWMVAQSTPSSSDPSSSQTPSSSAGQSSAGQSSASDSSGMNGSETTLQGCLAGSAGSFTLTDASGTQYQLQGDTSKLSAHVNSEVEVKGSASSGSASSPSSAPGTAASSGASGAGSAGAKTFNVTKVKKISSSCSTGK